MFDLFFPAINKQLSDIGTCIGSIFNKSKKPFYFSYGFVNGTCRRSFNPIIAAGLNISISFLIQGFQGCVAYSLGFFDIRYAVYKIPKSLMIRTIAVLLNQIHWFFDQKDYP